MKTIACFLLILFGFSSCTDEKIEAKDDFVISNGQMPNLVKDRDRNIHVVFGSGDSIMYTVSVDQGQTFSNPVLISVLPALAASHTRGPQIAVTSHGLTVLACNASGDIFSFNKTDAGIWRRSGKVNDVDTTAKENLMSLSGDGEYAFAVWLDLRGNKHNKVYGAKSIDGGRTWLANKLIYASPDSTVCECCKPSVVVKGNNVYIMFRNWLEGNRDLYLVQSTDAGESFGSATKLGLDSWKLNGCPMDGGSLAIANNGEVQTVWRRDGKVYTATPGKPEQVIGEGKGCTLTSVNGNNVYAWSENGEVVIIKSDGQKKKLGKGSQAIVSALDNDHIICVWENNKQIHAAVLKL